MTALSDGDDTPRQVGGVWMEWLLLLTTLFDLKLVALFGRRARGLALQI